MTTKKLQINKLLELKSELDIGKEKKYNGKVVKDSIIYANKIV